MNDSLARDVIDLKAEVMTLRVDIQQLKLNEAANAVRFENLKEDTASIKKVLNWIATVVIGSILTYAVSFIVNGGISGI